MNVYWFYLALLSLVEYNKPGGKEGGVTVHQKQMPSWLSGQNQFVILLQ